MRWILLLGTCLLPMHGFAGTWTEVQDAPDLPPAQSTRGSGPLDSIAGAFLDGSDADVFRIRIGAPATFSAATVSATDTQIFLLDENGLGIAANDDPNSQTLQGTLVPGDPLTRSLLPGVYLLGVSQFDIVPLAGGLRIFPVDLFDEALGPDGPGGPGPADSWGGDDFGLAASYTVSLTGASFAVPEVSQGLGLLVVGVVLAASLGLASHGPRRG